MSAASHGRTLSAAAHEAIGALEGQQVVDGLRDGSIEPPEGWLRFVELTARHGRNSPATRAFVVELCKRLAVGTTNGQAI